MYTLIHYIILKMIFSSFLKIQIDSNSHHKLSKRNPSILHGKNSFMLYVFSI